MWLIKVINIGIVLLGFMVFTAHGGEPLCSKNSSIKLPQAQEVSESALKASKLYKGLMRIRKSNYPIRGKISIEEAIARAILYNLDFQARTYEQILQNYDLKDITFELLPSLGYTVNLTNKNTPYAATSRSLKTGTTQLDYGISEDLMVKTGDYSLSWNALEFIIGKTRMKQKKAEIEVTKEGRRRALQSLASQVRGIYYKVMAYQILSKKVRQIDKLIDETVDKNRLKIKSTLEPINNIYGLEQELLEYKRNINSIISDLSNSKIDLAVLMNIRPDQEYQVVEYGINDIPSIKLEANDLINYALYNRPEINEEFARSKQAKLGIDMLIQEALPRFGINAARHSSSNSYLFYPKWQDLAISLSMNLIKLIGNKNKLNKKKIQEKLEEDKIASTIMGIIGQIAVSHQRYTKLKDDIKINKQIFETSSKSSSYLEAASSDDVGAESKLDATRGKIRSFINESRYLLSYAECMQSLGELYNSIGFDPVKEFDNKQSFSSLINAVGNQERIISSKILAK